MRPSKVKDLLITAFRNKQQVCLIGAPGTGKSDLIDEACAAIDANVVTKHPSIEDPTVPLGLPASFQRDGKQVAEFLPFGEHVKLIEATKLTVCHLEDFGQAVPSVQAAYMQQLLRRAINGTKISDHVVYVASTNDTCHMAGVGGLIEPVKSRFHTLIQLEVSTDDWCNWALNHNVPPELVAFIRFRPALLHAFKPTKELKNSPCPRTWAAVGRWLNCGVKDLEVFQGAVGEGAATEFFAFLDLYGSLPSLDAILLNPSATEVPEKPAQLFAVATGLARKATKNNFDRVCTYLARLPKEFEVLCVKDAVTLTRECCNSAAFTTWATKNSDVVL